jgi:DNA-binding response OmpR family regulator
MGSHNIPFRLWHRVNQKIWFPIIILTAYSVEEIRNNLLEYGIIDLLVKPLDIVVLKEKIKTKMKILSMAAFTTVKKGH